jgi:DNA replication and repair protein RecF
MRLRKITLQHFRNIGFAELHFDGRQQFLIGANGQGKTNLLEAAGFFTALRSFRTTDTRLLIAHGQTEAALACELEHERFGETRVFIKLRPGGKEVSCDGEKVTRLGDFLGRFPTVVFSSQDQQLVRGSPGGRRRWLDLTLAGTDAAYLQAFQRYHRALAERNSLLKTGTPRVEELTAFEHPLAEAAAELVRKREEGVAALSGAVASAYGAIADSAETAGLAYAPNASARDAAAWLEIFARGRARDAAMRTTLAGPHRDELELTVAERTAREFGSEGQQRSLAIALRLAEVSFVRERAGVQPVLLADDVLGELDPARRRRFWTSLGEERQVIATGTSLPDAELGRWQVFSVTGGAFAPMGGTEAAG